MIYTLGRNLGGDHDDHTHNHSHTHHGDESRPSSAVLIGNQVGALLAMLLVALLGCVVPLYLDRVSSSSRKSMCNTGVLARLTLIFIKTFAGGAFLGLGLFHLLPEAIEQLEKAGGFIYVDGHAVATITYVLVFVGYALLLFMEHVLVNSSESSTCGHHAAGNNEKAVTPTVEEPGSQTALNNNSFCDSCHLTIDCNSCRDSIIDEGSLEFEMCSNNEKPGSLEFEMRSNNESPVIRVDTQETRDQVNAASHEPVSKSTASETQDLAKRSCPHSVRRLRSAVKLFESPTFFVCLALGVHSLFEGMIVGGCSFVDDVWITTLVILGHKGAAAVAIGTLVFQAQVSKVMCCVYLSIFILGSPLGVVLGMVIVDAGSDASAGVLNSLATGTVLYISNEIITSEFVGGGTLGPRVTKYAGFIFGAAVVFGLSLLHFHSH